MVLSARNHACDVLVTSPLSCRTYRLLEMITFFLFRFVKVDPLKSLLGFLILPRLLLPSPRTPASRSPNAVDSSPVH